MKKNYLNVVLVAGELSGDILGSGLILELKKHSNKIKFFGIVGPQMKKAGCKIWYHIDDVSTIGIWQSIYKIPYLLKVRKDIINRCILLKPDVFIGIDFPDFNLSLEKTLKKYGIFTVHYVSPSIWAWRKNRILKIIKAVDLILVFFLFEKKIYDQFNIPCICVGHIAADKIPLFPNKISVRKKLGIKVTDQCLLLLPGSRISEIQKLTEIFLETASLLKINRPHLKILIPIVNKKIYILFKKIKQKVAKNLEIMILNHKNSYRAMIASDVALVASGTATLECMLSKCPMIVAYKVDFITFWIVKYLIKINYIALPNILANKKIVKEFLQNQCNPKILSNELNNLLNTNNDVSKIFLNIHSQIKLNANKKAVNAILKLIKN